MIATVKLTDVSITSHSYFFVAGGGGGGAAAENTPSKSQVCSTLLLVM